MFDLKPRALLPAQCNQHLEVRPALCPCSTVSEAECHTCRVLDDATFATLSSLMLFNNVEVLMALTKDPRFFPELFRRLGSGPDSGGARPDASWVDLVSFLQVC